MGKTKKKQTKGNNQGLKCTKIPLPGVPLEWALFPQSHFKFYSSMHNSKPHVRNFSCFPTCLAFGKSLELAQVCDPSSSRLTHGWIYELSLFLLLPDSFL